MRALLPWQRSPAEVELELGEKMDEADPLVAQSVDAYAIGDQEE